MAKKRILLSLKEPQIFLQNSSLTFRFSYIMRFFDGRESNVTVEFEGTRATSPSHVSKSILPEGKFTAVCSPMLLSERIREEPPVVCGGPRVLFFFPLATHLTPRGSHSPKRLESLVVKLRCSSPLIYAPFYRTPVNGIFR